MKSIINVLVLVLVLALVCGVGIGGYATFSSIKMALKAILSKKFGQFIEATVVNAVEKNAKGSITYNVDCEFEYNGKIIKKTQFGMREKNIHSVERYIGKKYMVFYYPKYDYMLIEQEYSKVLLGGILFTIICSCLVIITVLTLLSNIGYINL